MNNLLSDIESAIAKSWLQAAEDLGIKITSPFVLTLDSHEYLFIAFLRNFGSQKGTLICTIDQWKIYLPVARSQGFYCSGLADSYAKYDRQEFIDTLDDWGWYGSTENKPSWYTGKPWS